MERGSWPDKIMTLPDVPPALKHMVHAPHVQRVSIIGSGEFGRAMAKRLLRSGYEVAIGSRRPSKAYLTGIDDAFFKVQVMSTQECIDFSDVIILAMHYNKHASLAPFSRSLVGKTIIDVSNADHHSAKSSNAQNLASLFPKASIVKAFNTVSAYALAEEFEDPRPVYVCSDDILAKKTVLQLANQVGYFGVDSGPLSEATKLEQRNLQQFSGWGRASAVSFGITIVWLAYGILRYCYIRQPNYTLERIPMNIVHKATGCASVTILACVYLPGCLAAIAQLCYGTARKRFSSGLDKWLKMRKQLGLFALLIAAIHSVMSMGLMNPDYLGTRFYLSKVQLVPVNQTDDLSLDVGSRLNWVGETAILFGVLAIAAMTVLGISSLPSVARNMSWREWVCIQSNLGIVCLIFAAVHCTIMGFPGWINKPFLSFVQGMKFNSMILPWFTIALRLFLLLPCVFYKVRTIRNGWERKSSDHTTKDIEASSVADVSLVNVPSGTSSPLTQKQEPFAINGHSNPSFEQAESGSQ